MSKAPHVMSEILGRCQQTPEPSGKPSCRPFLNKIGQSHFYRPTQRLRHSNQELGAYQTGGLAPCQARPALVRSDLVLAQRDSRIDAHSAIEAHAMNLQVSLPRHGAVHCVGLVSGAGRGPLRQHARGHVKVSSNW